jgi:alcohol dehydrogenase
VNNLAPFALGPLPRILFGAGSLENIPEQAAGFGDRALIVTGKRWLRASEYWKQLEEGFREHAVHWLSCGISDEPSPEQIDQVVSRFHPEKIDVVVGIGGGSVLDAAKAIAGLLAKGNSVMDHLEGVGNGVPYTGPATPFLAVPTTAGTGSEATRNAVLTQRGENGFKKSFRHEKLVAHTTIVDPELLATCPYDQMAAQGMDAFTQLLEAYVSRNASPMTDALAWSGIEAFAEGFFPALEGGSNASAGRSKLAYASLMSGICLAHAGLGSVHGLASALGAFFPIPHGMVCGTLLAEAVDVNLSLLQQREPDSPALKKYDRVGEVLSDQSSPPTGSNHQRLVARLRDWSDQLKLRRLGEYGVTEADIPRIFAARGGGNMQSNPVAMTEADVVELIRRRL